MNVFNKKGQPSLNTSLFFANKVLLVIFSHRHHQAVKYSCREKCFSELRAAGPEKTHKKSNLWICKVNWNLMYIHVLQSFCQVSIN